MLEIYQELWKVFPREQARALSHIFHAFHAVKSLQKHEFPIDVQANSPTGFYVTREQMQELDRRAIEEYKIPGILLMENAGAAASRHILARTQGPVSIFCGRGNNGGDGFVIARHLHNHGVPVDVYFLGNLSDVPRQSDPGSNLAILRSMGILPVEIHAAAELERYARQIEKSELLIDAIFGTGLSGTIREPFLEIMQMIESWNRPIVAIDIPSGLDANTGEVLGVALTAFWTITFGLPKVGFTKGQGPALVGDVIVADISLPRELVLQVEKTK